MSKIEIKPVTTRKELQQFVQFFYDLYRDCKYAVPYIYSEEMSALREDKNTSFECCEAQYFMAFRDGKLVGRVAAIINHRANERWDRKQVRFSWFDFVDDPEVSAALLKTVEDWGRQKGMTEIAGPIGFIDTDREGMLVDGFDTLSTMYINYNYPYYPQHMEQLAGYEKANDWVELRVKVPERVPDKFAKITEMVRKRYGLRVHKFTRKELIAEGWGKRIFDLLNETYKDLYGFSQLSDYQINHALWLVASAEDTQVAQD